MSFNVAGDVNVLLSSPRVGFGEPPPTTTTTSLLTFADMVLALDHKHISDNVDHRSSFVEIKSESDHTYASSRSCRTTRSQTAKAAALLTTKDNKVRVKKECLDDLSYSYESNENHIGSPTSPLEQKFSDIQSGIQCLKDKRCSSVENIYHSHFSANRACEWPQENTKNSPRKSCSFEEVSCDNEKTCMKSYKSSETVLKMGVSHTLHRFVNNTLEFPCWPRKADHTYATATWDGTAASHSLFEQDGQKLNTVEDQEMRDDAYIDDTAQSHVNQCENELPDFSVNHFQNFPQKDDHTYVKSKISSVNISGGIEAKVQDSCGAEKQSFSFATFPRQKMREDHTYFHSGFSKKSTGREWASTQTVGSSTEHQYMQIEEAYRNLHSFSQSASAKKDHNYSTST